MSLFQCTLRDAMSTKRTIVTGHVINSSDWIGEFSR